MAALSKEQQANGNETQTHQTWRDAARFSQDHDMLCPPPKDLLSCRDTWLGPE